MKQIWLRNWQRPGIFLKLSQKYISNWRNLPIRVANANGLKTNLDRFFLWCMSKHNVYLCADQRLYSEYLPNLPHSHFKQEKGCRINLWYSGVKKKSWFCDFIARYFATKLGGPWITRYQWRREWQVISQRVGFTYLITSKSFAKSKYHSARDLASLRYSWYPQIKMECSVSFSY